MKKKVIIIAVVSILVLGVGGICAGFAWNDYNRFEVKRERVTIELGGEVQVNLKDYIDANKKALEETTLDTSNVDIMKAGTYKIHAVWKDHKADIEVVVKDTVAPEVILKDTKELKVMVGQELKASDLIEKVNDLAEIKTVAFNKNQIELMSDSENPLDKIGLKFDTAGEQTVKFIAEDNNGNKTEEKITVKVIEDYLAHISGFHDITTEQGTKPDWMEGITSDDKIAGITVDESTVDINTPGEYTLKYVITGNDNVTVVEQTVKVTVTEKVVVSPVNNRSSSSNRNSGQNSGNSNSRPSGNRSSKSNSSFGSGGSSDNSEDSGGSYLDELVPGQTGTSEDEYTGYIDGENGNTYTGGEIIWN